MRVVRVIRVVRVVSLVRVMGQTLEVSYLYPL